MDATLQLDPCDKCGRKVHHVCRVFNKRADKLLLCKGCDAAQGLHGKKPSFIRFSPESACFADCFYLSWTFQARMCVLSPLNCT
jgi:hypothetical protein